MTGRQLAVRDPCLEHIDDPGSVSRLEGVDGCCGEIPPIETIELGVERLQEVDGRNEKAAAATYDSFMVAPGIPGEAEARSGVSIDFGKVRLGIKIKPQSITRRNARSQLPR